MINLILRSHRKTGITLNFHFYPTITWLLLFYGSHTIYAAIINDTTSRIDNLDNGTCSTDIYIDAAMKISKNLNNSVDPCENFYQYVCGNFGKESPNVNDSGHVDQFSLIFDKVQRQIKELMDKDIEPEEPHIFTMIKMYYRSCLNTTDVEFRGLEPLQKIMDKLGGWPVVLGDAWREDNFTWHRIDRILQPLGYNPRYIFRIFVMQDVKNSSRNILYIGTLESEMKDLQHDDNLMKTYIDFMIDVAVLFGADKNRAESELEEAITFEKYLLNAKYYSPNAQAEMIFDKVKIKDLQRIHPYVSWLEYLNDITTYDYRDNDEVYIENPNYLQGVQDLLSNTSQRVIANYMLWRTVYDSVDYLNDRIGIKKLLLDKAQTGKTRVQSRGNKCFKAMMNRNVGLLPGISAMYMQHFFNNDSRDKIAKMVTGIRGYYENILKENSNFSRNMTSTALRKNERIKEVIGYPEELANGGILKKYYDNLTIEPNNFFGNTLNLRKFAYKKGIDRLKKSPNETFWIDVGEAADVQVFYHAIYNAIVLPASILQYPFFDENQPNYLNYGSTGFLIGHEISHAFVFGENPTDEDGIIRTWWTREDQENFRKKANCFIKHYNNFTDGTDSKKIGRRNIQENIPDSEGMKAAISAYKKWKSQNGEEKTLPYLNYTDEQLFWISTTSLMCTRRTKELTKLLYFTDEHPTEEMRINGAISNSIEFSEAFKCQLGSRMNPNEKCSFWF